MTQQYMYAQPVYQDRVTYNVQVAYRCLPAALQQLYNSGQITPAEFTNVSNLINQPQVQNSLRDKVITSIGANQYTDQSIYEFVVNLLLQTIQGYRQSAVNYSAAPQAMSNYYGQQPQMGQSIPFTGANTNDVAQLYGNTVGTSGTTGTPVSPNATPTQGQAPHIGEKHPPAEITGSAIKQVTYNLNNEDVSIYSKPVIKTIDNEIVSNVSQNVGRSFEISCGNLVCKCAEVKLTFPVSNLQAAVNEFVGNNDSHFNNKFIHLLSYDQLTVFDTDYGDAVNRSKRIQAKFNEKGAVNRNIESIIRDELNAGGTYGEYVSSVILALFNNAMTIGLARVTPNNTIKRFLNFSSINEIAELFITSDVTKEIAGYALKDTIVAKIIQASFGRLFDKGKKCWADISSDAKMRIIVQSSELHGIRVADYPLRLASCLEQDEKLRTAIANALRKIFPMLIEKKVLIHNLDLPSIGPRDFGFNMVQNSPEKEILSSLFDIYGFVEMVHIDEPFDLVHPITLGRNLDGLMLRKRS